MSANDTTPTPMEEPKTFGLPTDADRWIIQLGTTTFSVFVRDGVVLDSGSRYHRWSIGKQWQDVQAWLQDKGAAGKLYEPPTTTNPAPPAAA